MKKLKKLSLNQLRDEKPVIKENALDKLIGGYDNDCFWQCVALIQSNFTGNDWETAAEGIALDYLISGRGMTPSEAEEYLTCVGATDTDIAGYFSYLGSEYNPDYDDNQYIVKFNTSDVSTYQNDGLEHAVVIMGRDSSGLLTYYDPQQKSWGTFAASDEEYLDYAGY